MYYKLFRILCTKINIFTFLTYQVVSEVSNNNISSILDHPSHCSIIKYAHSYNHYFSLIYLTSYYFLNPIINQKI